MAQQPMDAPIFNALTQVKNILLNAFMQESKRDRVDTTDKLEELTVPLVKKYLGKLYTC
jgi:hypothetical protein